MKMNTAALFAAMNGDLANAMIASTPGGIEVQEAAGQQKFVASTTIPKEIHGATREQLTAIGFKFGDDADDLFVNCELPDGWTKRATDHSMHNDLMDEKGRRRAGIFYKAAFYDQRADMNMVCRFGVGAYFDGSRPDYFRCVATDCDTIIFDAGEWKSGDWASKDLLQAACAAFLKEKYPEWNNPLAHW